MINFPTEVKNIAASNVIEILSLCHLFHLKFKVEVKIFLKVMELMNIASGKMESYKTRASNQLPCTSTQCGVSHKVSLLFRASQVAER